MTPEQRRRVRLEFDWLAEYCPPTERGRAVRERCGDDPDVLAEVDRLVGILAKNADGASGRDGRVSDVVGDGVRADGPSAADAGPAHAATAAANLLRAGELVLGRYEIGELLGRGGFGCVHRAVDRVTRETVAVKAVELARGVKSEMYLREVASMRRARVPGVVELLAAAHDDDRAIIVMAFVEGASFPGDGVAVGDAATILPRGIALLETMGRLYASGVYHRDLKPTNVLVSAEGRVTVVDLGIAQDETDAERWRPSHREPGTLAYMAPERLHGARASASTEVYSVGVMLIAALTGEVPVTGRGVVDGGPQRDPAHEKLVARVAPPVARLLASMIARDPRDRPRDAATTAARLREALGRPEEIELPRLGSDAAVRAVLDAALAGRPLDVVGPPGSGRSRALAAASERMREAGLLVNWVRPSPAAATAASPDVVGAPIGDATPDALDRDLVESLRRRVADGLVLLVDDFDALDAPTRRLVEAVRTHGAVIRVVRTPAGDCVRLADLSREELAPLVRGPERIFHVPSQAARLLWDRTRGRVGDVHREVASWCATGLARWTDGAAVVGPKELDRLRAVAPVPCAETASADLSAAARLAWNALTLAGAAVPVAAVADMLQAPRRVVDAELDALAAAGLVRRSDDGERVELLRGSPLLADVPIDVRSAWSERAAARLPARSEARFRHLMAAGLHESACRAALDVAAAHVDAGDVPAAMAVLDPALGIARRHVPEATHLYGELLSAMADAALMRSTRLAIDLALYHANLAPGPGGATEAWTAVLDAAAAVVDGDARRAAAILDAAPSLPSEAHRRAAVVVGVLAGRMTRSLEVQRRFVVRAASWARRLGGARDARATASAATGWLRYEQGRFEAAWRLQARAARLTRRPRSRITALCNAAMAAVEACRLAEASALAEDALRAARRAGDSVNEARAELLLRQCAYRLGTTTGVDAELVEAAASLDRDGTRGMIRLTEAAVAWRARRLELAAALAADAAADLRAAGFGGAAALAAALCAAAGGRSDVEILASLSTLGERLEPVGIAAQAAALATASSPASLVARAREWACSAPNPDVRREVLSPRETALRLEGVSGAAALRAI